MGSHLISAVRQLWNRFVPQPHRDMRLQAPAVVYVNPRFDPEGPAELSQSFASGDCLAPTFLDGDHFFYNTTIKARAGEFAVIDMRVRKISKIDGTESEGFVQACKKVHREKDGSWWYTSNQPAFRREGHRLRGVMMLAVRYPTVFDGGEAWTLDEIRPLVLQHISSEPGAAYG